MVCTQERCGQLRHLKAAQPQGAGMQAQPEAAAAGCSPTAHCCWSSTDDEPAQRNLRARCRHLPVEFHASTDPRPCQADQRRLNHILTVEEVVAAGLVLQLRLCLRICVSACTEMLLSGGQGGSRCAASGECCSDSSCCILMNHLMTINYSGCSLPACLPACPHARAPACPPARLSAQPTLPIWMRPPSSGSTMSCTNSFSSQTASQA